MVVGVVDVLGAVVVVLVDDAGVVVVLECTVVLVDTVGRLVDVVVRVAVGVVEVEDAHTTAETTDNAATVASTKRERRARARRSRAGFTTSLRAQYTEGIAGGGVRIRTGVRGFAGPCLTARPRRQKLPA